MVILQTVTDVTKFAIGNTESHLQTLHWHIYIWPSSILKVKVKVKVMHISTEYLANGKLWIILLLSFNLKSCMDFD